MGLHARQVAVAAGAVGDEVEKVAEEIPAAGHATLDAALAALSRLRKAARAVEIKAVDVAE
jgi:hydroxymethylglutaryl-CoA reductase